MDVNEIITLSSDEEKEEFQSFQIIKKYKLDEKNEASKITLNNFSTTVNSNLNKSSHCKDQPIKSNTHFNIHNMANVMDESYKNMPQEIIQSKTPEVVDLDECLQVSVRENNSNIKNLIQNFTKQTYNRPSTKCIIKNECSETSNSSFINVKTKFENNRKYQENNKSDKIINLISCKQPFPMILSNALKDSSGKKAFYDKFVDFCLSLEEIPNDKSRLQKKLYKYYNNSNPKYIASEKFKFFIEKCTQKLNKKNLYLVAKEVLDELSSRKKIEVRTNKLTSSESKEQEGIFELTDPNSNKMNKKHKKIISKIIEKLDALALKIRELEEAEVDLDDEENSSYVQLQRCRYRFCTIYKKLCQYTKENSDANRIYSRKICFSGSKYPKINNCIENFLNKTRKFPDFTDIMKLLESQSSSLGLSPNPEVIRPIAMEIFHKVGVLLQERRRYDLWDSFCGFLNDKQDPAKDDTALDDALKRNFENRIRKEQEIFTYYAEIQEKERLKAEDVPEEIDLSEVESSDEDEKEIDEVETKINDELDIILDTEYGDEENGGNEQTDSHSDDSEEQNIYPSFSEETETKQESKNNYKNCKSLKWREDKNMKTTPNIVHEAQNKPQVKITKLSSILEINENVNNDESVEDDSDVECIMCEPQMELNNDKIKDCKFLMSETNNLKPLTKDSDKNVKRLKLKRNAAFENSDLNWKKCRTSIQVNQNDSEHSHDQNYNSYIENHKKEDSKDIDYLNSIFEIRHCHVEYNFQTWNDKPKSCRNSNDNNKPGNLIEKVFRDLTNSRQILLPSYKKMKLISSDLFQGNTFGLENQPWNPLKFPYQFINFKEEETGFNYNQNTNLENIYKSNRKEKVIQKYLKGKRKNINSFLYQEFCDESDIMKSKNEVRLNVKRIINESKINKKGEFIGIQNDHLFNKIKKSIDSKKKQINSCVKKSDSSYYFLEKTTLGVNEMKLECTSNSDSKDNNVETEIVMGEKKECIENKENRHKKLK